MTRVMLTGAAGPLGRRVLSRLAGAPDVTEIIAVDAADMASVRADWSGHASLVAVRGPLTALDLEDLVGGVDHVVHLAAGSGDEIDGTGVAGVDVAGTRVLLEALDRVECLVLLSSAMVYGAWPQNPVPMTERALVRPNSGLVFASEKAELERLVACWADAQPRRPMVAVMRPTVTLSAESTEWMTRSIWGVVGLRAGSDVPPAQFLHIDDLASAVELARSSRLDGVFNVAPDGWIPPDDLAGLRGVGPRAPLPPAVAARLTSISHRWSVLATPWGAVPYTMYPWVVANDSIRAAGWSPDWSNEEAFVIGTKAGPWATLDARRRQEVGLVGAVVGLGALAAGGVAAVRRWAR